MLIENDLYNYAYQLIVKLSITFDTVDLQSSFYSIDDGSNQNGPNNNTAIMYYSDAVDITPASRSTPASTSSSTLHSPQSSTLHSQQLSPSIVSPTPTNNPTMINNINSNRYSG
jgi:hypothetical protein